MKLLRDSKQPLKEELLLENIQVPMQAHLAGSDSFCTLLLYFQTVAKIQEGPKGEEILNRRSNRIFHFDDDDYDLVRP